MTVNTKRASLRRSVPAGSSSAALRNQPSTRPAQFSKLRWISSRASRVAVADLERQIADRATHAALVRADPLAILIQQHEHALERIDGRRLGRPHDHRLEIVERELEHLQEQVVLAREEVIHAAGIDAGLAQDRGDACRVITLLVEELKRRLQQTLARLERGRAVLLERPFKKR